MSQSARTHLGARAARGFSLAEVLMATIIIALGTLGLLAVFAGAAFQQQSASQNTKGAFSISNAESLITQNFGTLQATTGFASLPENDWYRLAMDQDNYQLLVVPPEVTGNDVYALKTVYDEELYLGASLQDDSRVDCSSPAADDAQAMSTPSTPITFTQRKLEPKSIRLSVSVRFFNADEMRWEYTPSRDFYRNDNGDLNEGTELWLAGDELSPTKIFVDPEHTEGSPEFAKVTGWNINYETDPSIFGALPSNSCCKSLVITATEYSWRSESLVSLNDRMVTRRDATGSEARFVPDLAMSVAFRRKASGAQAAIFIYQLTPDSGRAEYIPPETASDITGNDSPLRLAEDLKLGYDPALEQYYFEGDHDDDAWVIASGQVLLVVGVRAGVATDASKQGADAPVRVERVVRNGNTLRGYIDRAPRFNNRSMLRAIDRENGTTVQLDVLAVSDVVRSRASDNSAWKLRPLEAKVIDLPVNP